MLQIDGNGLMVPDLSTLCPTILDYLMMHRDPQEKHDYLDA